MSLVVRNLIQVDPRSLDRLMDEEASVWREVLSWDYRPTTEFLKSYIRRHVLPGYVLFDGQQPVGYLYMVIEGNRGIIGSVYVARTHWGGGLEQQLANSAIDALRSLTGIERIETQLMIFSQAGLESTFLKAGFERYRRFFLSMDLGARWHGERTEPPLLELRDWRNNMIFETARVVFESYRKGIDSHFSYNFSRPEKCREFVANLVERAGCGRFLPGMTTVGFIDSAMVGIVIATELSEGTGHLPQISVAPLYQGKGLGAFLVAESLHRFREADYSSVSLTVTELNEPAHSWYRRIGFEEILPFNAYLWRRSR